MVVGFGPAELVDILLQELRGFQLQEPVEGNHLVERALGRALPRGAVIAKDVEDERIVEDLQVGQGVDQTPDMVVGVLQEPGIDLHLAG